MSCDALNYLTASDMDGTLTGSANSVLVSNYNPSLAGDVTSCQPRADYGAALCTFPLRSVVLDNMDRDRTMRFIGPVKLTMSDATENRTTFSRGLWA